MAFAKVNVDSQSTIARSAGVSAMPTFKIYHAGNCVDTIKGANPSALGEAISKAAKLADAAGGGKPGDAFKSPGRTLGAESAGGVRSSRGSSYNLNMSQMINLIVSFVGLYLVSLFSVCIPT